MKSKRCDCEIFVTDGIRIKLVFLLNGDINGSVNILRKVVVIPKLFKDNRYRAPVKPDKV